MSTTAEQIKGPDGFYTWEVITPEIATKMLKNNTMNRRIRSGHVNTLAHAMAAGEWMETGQGIAIDWDGIILNGQHTLSGIIQSGVTIGIWVIRKLDPRARKYYDRDSRPRSAGDSFYMEGRSNAETVAACIKLMHKVALDGHWRHRKSMMWAGQYETYYHVFPSIQRWADTAASYKRPTVLVPSLIAGLGVLFEMAQKEEGDAEEFMDKLMHGINLEEGSPLLLLRDRLARSRYITEAKLSPHHAGWLVIKVWNLIYTGKQIKRLAILHKEKAPSIEGLDATLLPYFGEGYEMPRQELTLVEHDDD